MTKLELERLIQWKLSHVQYVHFLLTGELPDGGILDDGLARRVRSRTNKALLRMAGNGWCYPNAKIIYQWIVREGK